MCSPATGVPCSTHTIGHLPVVDDTMSQNSKPDNEQTEHPAQSPAPPIALGPGPGAAQPKTAANPNDHGSGTDAPNHLNPGHPDVGTPSQTNAVTENGPMCSQVQSQAALEDDGKRAAGSDRHDADPQHGVAQNLPENASQAEAPGPEHGGVVSTLASAGVNPRKTRSSSELGRHLISLLKAMTAIDAPWNASC
jgi:hypothetical protein